MENRPKDCIKIEKKNETFLLRKIEHFINDFKDDETRKFLPFFFMRTLQSRGYIYLRVPQIFSLRVIFLED